MRHGLPEEKLRAIAIDNNRGHQFGSNEGADASSAEEGTTDVLGDNVEVVNAFEEGKKKTFDKTSHAGQGTCWIYVAGKGHGRIWAQSQFPSEEDIHGFREATEDYNTAMGKLAFTLLPVYARALGMPALEHLGSFPDPKRHTWPGTLSRGCRVVRDVRGYEICCPDVPGVCLLVVPRIMV